jgi:hypothetical protein
MLEFIALCLNFAVTTAVSLATAAKPNPFEEDVEALAATEAVS